MANHVQSSTHIKRYSITISFFFIFLCIFTFFYGFSTKPHNQNLSFSSKLHYHQTFLSLASNDTVSLYHRALTRHPHLAGTPASDHLTHLVTTHFQTLGLPTHTREYDVLLSYPTRVSLTAHFPVVGNVEFNLTDDARVVMPYHAYSPSGAVVSPAVYANYGGDDDYRMLDTLGVNVTGCVVVVRRGVTMSRGDVVRKAAEMGAAAVLTYRETETEADYEAEKGVERGTVMKGVGDALTPGWGSVLGGERLKRNDNDVVERFPNIPSMPVSLETAVAILGSLEGAQVPLLWRAHTPNVRVYSGVGPGPTVLNFSYQGEEKLATIRDVFAVIKGLEEPDRYVLIGNHRDAWTFGAVDPNSGTAALFDVARRYAHLIASGWQPRRTIVLCSWDAEEFGMIGSTEWVEDNIMNLGSKAVAYLNVDCAAQGPGLFPSATPQLDDLLIDITKKVKDPDAEGMTVYEEWTTRNKGINIQRLSGVDSDFAPFLQHAGIPSLDIYFGKDFPVYHTAFDSYDWMIAHGDPLFHRHVAVAGLWGLLALRLADDQTLPFNYTSYAVQLQEYTDTLSRTLEGRVSVAPITDSIQHLFLAAKEVQGEAKKLRQDESQSNHAALKGRILNDRLMLAERGLLDSDGLLGNKWFKHLVYGPSKKHDPEHAFFPSIANAVSEMKTSEDEAAIQHEIWRVARAIQRFADALRGDLP
ncbi:hypothetical protein RND81_08G165400 [Saponaria officinalis]|uniref:glutamate carboxypeptidase II n=1 Tax=Saponaria officinalis TaxID=3572 RepID=A0AAW1J8W8_SAPOF